MTSIERVQTIADACTALRSAGAGGFRKKILSNGSKKTRKTTNHPEEQKIF